jgi:hypothetical protein
MRFFMQSPPYIVLFSVIVKRANMSQHRRAGACSRRNIHEIDGGVWLFGDHGGSKPPPYTEQIAQFDLVAIAYE